MKFSGIFILSIGIITLLILVIGLYYEFFVPKLGPIGTGERHISVYLAIFSLFITGIWGTISGIYFILKSKQLEKR